LGKSLSERGEEADRLDKFRAMAEEAKDAARNAKTAQLREEYESLVHAWQLLIWEMEALEVRRRHDGSTGAEHATER
jgi:hypothetical protein